MPVRLGVSIPITRIWDGVLGPPLEVVPESGLQRTDALGLQISKSNSYLHTVGPEVCVVHVLGLPAILKSSASEATE